MPRQDDGAHVEGGRKGRLPGAFSAAARVGDAQSGRPPAARQRAQQAAQRQDLRHAVLQLAPLLRRVAQPLVRPPAGAGAGVLRHRRAAVVVLEHGDHEAAGGQSGAEAAVHEAIARQARGEQDEGEAAARRRRAAGKGHG